MVKIIVCTMVLIKLPTISVKDTTFTSLVHITMTENENELLGVTEVS